MNFPNIHKRPWANIDLMIIGFLYIVHGFIILFSLGFSYWNPPLEYIMWRTKKMINVQR